MELAVEILKYAGITAIGGGLAWLFSKLKTPREKKASDLELINNAINCAISPLLKSISELTKSYAETVEKLVAEQTKNRKLWGENARLADKVESLEKQVEKLTNVIKKLANEKDIDNVAY